ncbi:MAG: cytochrome C [bacterium]|nr:cytochrome C [bacterium]
MEQLYSPRANLIFAIVAISAFSFLIIATIVIYTLSRSSLLTDENVALSQPVPFSHAHHVGGLGIDCRYCHTTVEKSNFAGMPGSDTCMNCHSQLWTNAKLLEPVRQSYKNNTPIHWNRVYDLPDFVYFNHSIHVNKGISCYYCHGRVDQMPLMKKNEPVFMKWCLDCHRSPEKHLQPEGTVFSVSNNLQPNPQQAQALKEYYNIPDKGLTNCTVCHR